METKTTVNTNTGKFYNGEHRDGYSNYIYTDNYQTPTSKTEEQLPSGGDHIDNSYSAKESLCERIFSWRSFMVVLLHFSFAINIIPVVTMSMALVCMCGPVSQSRNGTLNETTISMTSSYAEYRFLENDTLPKDTLYEFNWSSETRGLLISGYLFTVFLVPHLSNLIRSYIGNKLTLTLFSLTLALTCFMTPIAARTSVHLFLGIRVLTGLCINANVPISGDTLAWWLPAQEKLTSATIVVSGWIVGGVLGPLIAGYFCVSGVDNGWPLIFYFCGSLTVVWTITWHCLSSRKPENHAFISEKEKSYIVAHRVGMSQVNAKIGDRPPYRVILTSRPVLAYFVSGVCHLWVFILIFACLPMYLTSVHKFSLQQAGIVFSLMSAFRLPAALLYSVLGNWLLNRKSMTTNRTRKICFFTGQVLASLLCVSVSFLDENHKWLASVLVVAAVMAATFGTTLSSVIPLDMAPRYAGFITGVNSSLSCLASITAPLTAAAIAATGTFETWRVVWAIMAVANFSAGAIFLAFGNASQQPWAVPKISYTTNVVQSQRPPDQIRDNDPAFANLCPRK